MSYPHQVVGGLPSEGIYLDALRRLISIVGVRAIHITLVKVDGGYSINAHSGSRAPKSFYLKTEKAQSRRVFKSPLSAFKVCKELGYDRISVEL